MHVKDPVVHVRVRWMSMETRRDPACTKKWHIKLIVSLLTGYYTEEEEERKKTKSKTKMTATVLDHLLI